MIAKARRALRECVCEGMRRGRKRECERERECVSKVGGLEGLEEESWKNPPQTARCWTPGDAGRIITVAVDTAVTGRGAPVGGFPGRGLAGQHLARYYFFLPGWALILAWAELRRWAVHGAGNWSDRGPRRTKTHQKATAQRGCAPGLAPKAAKGGPLQCFASCSV